MASDAAGAVAILGGVGALFLVPILWIMLYVAETAGMSVNKGTSSRRVVARMTSQTSRAETH